MDSSELQPGPLSTRFKYRYHGFARTFFSSMVQVASELGESALSSTVSVGGTNIVRAPEGGRHDCGWYTGSRPLPASGIERLLTISQDGDDQRAQIIPLDVKSNLPRTSADGEVTWKFKFTALQWKHCQAALLFSIKDPNFLALIPRAYFKGTYNIFTVQGSVEYPVASSKGIRPLWTLHPFPAFPPELAPFILPRKDLPKALTDMQAYSQGRTESWHNEHTGAIFHNLPKPLLVPPIMLEPDFPPWKEALKSCMLLYRALQDHSTELCLDFNQYYRFFGDCKAIHRSGVELFIECKSSHCRSFGSGASLRMDHLQTERGSLQDLFSWKAQWDFLFTVPRIEDAAPAFLIPRDRIPREWWTAEFELDHWLQWPEERSLELAKYVVDIRRPRLLASQAESILLDEQATPRKTSVRIPMKPWAPIAAHHDETGPDGSHADTLAPEYTWSSEGYVRGLGSFKHERTELRGNTSQSWSGEILMELSRIDGHSIVLDVGQANRRYRHLFLPYTWSKTEKALYDMYREYPSPIWRRKKKTPAVPLSFLRVSWIDGRGPTAVRNTGFSLAKGAQRAPSVVIGDAYPYTCARLPHNRFILPSEVLPAHAPRGNKVKPTRGFLQEYCVDAKRLFETFWSVMRAPNTITIGAATVTAANYLCTLEEVMSYGTGGQVVQSEEGSDAGSEGGREESEEESEGGRESEEEARDDEEETDEEDEWETDEEDEWETEEETEEEDEWETEEETEDDEEETEDDEEETRDDDEEETPDDNKEAGDDDEEETEEEDEWEIEEETEDDDDELL